MSATTEIATPAAPAPSVDGKRTLLTACGAHVLHDGYTDLLYILLPIWQAEFALGYAAVGALRALYSGTMAGFQVPASLLAERWGDRTVLVLGTALAGIAFLAAGWSGGFLGLAVALAIGGVGSSVQHPLASNLVAHAYQDRRGREALGTYNFSGDLGKMVFPALTAGLLSAWTWRGSAMVLGGIGLLVAAILAWLLPRGGHAAATAPTASESEADATRDSSQQRHHGFRWLLAIGIIDSATRMAFLTFLPFLLRAKGAGLPTLGLALTLIFAGGATGKFVCGFLGARLGVINTVWLTEGLTAVSILALLPLPLTAGLVLLPVVGLALNGTSSVLYGTVPELVPAEKRARAFGIFYTGTIGSGALAPILYGAFSDVAGVNTMMVLIGCLVLLILPLTWLLRPALRH